MSEQQPTIGRIVHYYDLDALPHAAIITNVVGPSSVDLWVFGRSGNNWQAVMINRHDNPGRADSANTWAWPPRV